MNIISIKTDATNFFSTVRSHMESKFCFAKKDSYQEVARNLYSIYDTHEEFVGSYNPFDRPHLIFSTVYQDGLIHAFQRILDQWHKAEYSDLHYLRGQIQLYENKISTYRKEKDYREVSYFTGYQTGLIHFDMINSVDPEEIPDVPHFFHPGVGLIEKEQFDNEIRDFPEIHKAALAQAKKLMAQMGTSGEVVIQHMPWG